MIGMVHVRSFPLTLVTSSARSSTTSCSRCRHEGVFGRSSLMRVVALDFLRQARLSHNSWLLVRASALLARVAAWASGHHWRCLGASLPSLPNPRSRLASCLPRWLARRPGPASVGRPKRLRAWHLRRSALGGVPLVRPGTALVSSASRGGGKVLQARAQLGGQLGQSPVRRDSSGSHAPWRSPMMFVPQACTSPLLVLVYSLSHLLFSLLFASIGLKLFCALAPFTRCELAPTPACAWAGPDPGCGRGMPQSNNFRRAHAQRRRCLSNGDSKPQNRRPPSRLSRAASASQRLSVLAARRQLRHLGCGSEQQGGTRLTHLVCLICVLAAFVSHEVGPAGGCRALLAFLSHNVQRRTWSITWPSCWATDWLGPRTWRTPRGVVCQWQGAFA